MLTFSTIFPIGDKATIDQVDNLTRTWLVGSQHSEFNDKLFKVGLGANQWSMEQNSERVNGMNIRDGDDRYLGLRHEREHEGVIWTTEVTFFSSWDTSRVAVQVHCESGTTALRLPPARKPYIVRQFLANMGGGKDGNLLVSDRPLMLSNGDIEFAVDLIEGNCQNELPIVYLSASGHQGTSLPPERLAHWLSGIAHVVAEPNREFSYRLMHEVGRRNAYGGAIGIYWPDLSEKELLLPKEYDFDPRSLAAEISRVVRDRAIRLRTPRKLTWAFQKELIAKQQIERLKNDGAADLDEFIQNFDDEIGAKEVALDQAEEEIRRLEAEVHGLRAQSKVVVGVPVLVRGTESDLYENETIDLLWEILSKALEESQNNSRRHHILQSLIAEIDQSTYREELMSRVKSVLSHYRKLDSTISNELEGLGFDVEMDGKHYKAIFRGDNRYVITMPKTSSDHRAGKNLVSQINRILF